jgi:small nuclear ribonucleoprotein (snRNP)-like protein
MSQERRRGGFDRFIVPVATRTDPTSPVNYVRSFLNKKLTVLVMDQRQFTGIFVCLNKNGQLWLFEAVEDTNGRERTVGKVIIPFRFVQAMEMREQ